MEMYGSVSNRFEEGATFCDKIEVGTGVTKYLWSDKHAFEVVEVIDQKHLLIRRCDAKRTDNNGMSECQDWEFTLPPYKEWTDTLGRKHTNNVKIVLTKKGWRERLSNGKLDNTLFSVGIKEEYFDPSF